MNSNMMKQLQQMQNKMTKLKDQLGDMTVTGTAGGGAVTVTANGHQKVLSVAIEPEALEEGAELLADMGLAATKDGLAAHGPAHRRPRAAAWPDLRRWH